MNFPTIQSIGPPPERHAERMAIEFARWLCANEQQYYPAWRHAILKRNDGNPKQQAKMVERLREAAGAALLDVSLQAGKRRKYSLCLHRLVGWDKGSLIDLDQPVPPAPWLALILDLIASTYATVRQEQVVISLISQHAIARLAERCGARNPYDLTEIARAMSIAILNTLGAVSRDDMPPEGWRIPFDGGIAIVKIDNDSQFPLVATVLPPAEEPVRIRTAIA